MAAPFRLPPPPTQSQNQNHPNVIDNYLTLRNSYFNMINNSDEDMHMLVPVDDPKMPPLVPLPRSTADQASAFASAHATHTQTDMDSFRELLELCGMTPETPMLATFDGSPLDETPLFTPALDMFGSATPYLDGWDTSPAMGDADAFDTLPPLFGEFSNTNSSKKNNNENATIADQSQLFTLPTTPALASTALAPLTASSNNANKGAKGPTGFRKGVTPAALVPIDAPTQPRQYLGDSKTSRKDVPAAFQTKARKRQHDEMLDDDDVPDDIQDAIAAKRRLNTLAARRSRARKAMTAQENEDRINNLEDSIRRLQEEVVRVTAERDAYRSQLGLI